MSNGDHNPGMENTGSIPLTPGGTGYYDFLLSGPLIPPGFIWDISSAAGMTGAIPTLNPKTDFPDYDNFNNLGMKS